ncbi:PAS domain S-box-containing protein [Arcticibacter pallidicorallinus]|uniref:histidine kinase n=1 Tax=Arcticibacter pallidicorallinus TaxID=1259464 RepID=A0A2T0TXD8_9SPHI|nr:PAS domain S-box protein [Arcticibacter pallidicorallinus]PRY50337.1 PAS domain S-box-containing protein [Arcticibacter pallidicorallinus]
MEDFNKPLISLNDFDLSSIFNSAHDAVITLDINGHIIHWNSAATRILGYTADEVTDRHIDFMIPKELAFDEKADFQRVVAGGSVEHYQTIRLSKNNQKVNISLTASLIRDAQGRVLGVSHIFHDLTVQKVAEEKQAMLAAIIESSDDAILSKTLDGFITSWNKGAELIFGYTEEEIIGEHISFLIPKERLSEEDNIISKIKRGIKVEHLETVRIGKGGRKIAVSLTISPVKDKDGNIIGASKIARDITKNKEAERAIKRHATDLAVLNTIGKAISEGLEAEMILQKVTDATTQLTGAEFGTFYYNTKDGIGNAIQLFATSAAAVGSVEGFGSAEFRALFDSIFLGGKIVRIEEIRKDERYLNHAPLFDLLKVSMQVSSLLVVPVTTKGNVVVGGLVFGHSRPAMFSRNQENLVAGVAAQAATALDNAKLYEEVRALNAKKDEFIGLASHELKTPLTSMKGFLQILERNESGELNRAFIKKALKQLNKISSLVSDLLDVSKIQSGKLYLDFETFDLQTLLHEVIELVQFTSETHEIELDSDSIVLPVQADKQRIEQVIINLISNAIKYSPDASKVLIRVRKTDLEVRVGIQDFGFGIETEQLENIFARFFRVESLASHISGLGIGLFITKEIVERHKGRIWVESEHGKGSEFFFTLPLIREFAG